MKKHILIGIPAILLHILSFSMFSYGTYTYYLYSGIEKITPESMSIHDKTFINKIENLKDKNKALTLAITKLKADEKNNSSKNIFTLQIASSAKNHFKTFAILAVIGTILSFMLIVGLKPIFKKVSNKAIKKDV